MKRFLNSIPVIALTIILGFIYLIEYIKLKQGTFNPDGIRFFIYYIPFAIFFIALSIYYWRVKNWSSSLFALISLFLHFIAVSNKGRYMPFNGLLITLILIVIWVIAVIYGQKKKKKPPIQ